MAQIAFIFLVIGAIICLVMEWIDWITALVIVVFLSLLLIFIRSDQSAVLTARIFGTYVQLKLDGPSKTRPQSKELPVQKNIVEEKK